MTFRFKHPIEHSQIKTCVIRSRAQWEPFLEPGKEGLAQERGCNGGSSLWISLTNGALRYRGTGFLHKLFAELLPPSCPLRMSPHSQPQSSAWVCSPNPTFQHPALVCCSGHPLRLGGQGWGQHTVLLPQTVAVFSSHREWGSSSTPTELPSRPSDGLPRMSTSPLFSSPTRIGGPILPLPFPSSFFCPTWLSRKLSCPLRCPRSSVSVQLGSVRVVPFAHVFLMHL